MGPLTRGLLVFVGAGIGGNLRFWLGQWIISRLGSGFPWHTMAVNVSGSFLIGLILGLLPSDAVGWRAFLVVGILGGYTTFSAFSMETVEIVRKGNLIGAAGNFLGSCLAGFVACWLGLVLAQAWQGT